MRFPVNRDTFKLAFSRSFNKNIINIIFYIKFISFLQIERAHKILRVLRGPRWNVTKELTDIKVALEGRETYNVRLRDFASATVWKPFLIALSLMFFFQFSGINVILHYTVDIFQSADSSVEEFQVKYF